MLSTLRCLAATSDPPPSERGHHPSSWHLQPERHRPLHAARPPHVRPHSSCGCRAVDATAAHRASLQQASHTCQWHSSMHTHTRPPPCPLLAPAAPCGSRSGSLWLSPPPSVSCWRCTAPQRPSATGILVTVHRHSLPLTWLTAPGTPATQGLCPCTACWCVCSDCLSSVLLGAGWPASLLCLPALACLIVPHIGSATVHGIAFSYMLFACLGVNGCRPALC